jgi:hypothetical protein
VDVIAGEWLAYVRRATSGERVDGLLVIHASFGPAYAMLFKVTTKVGTVVVDSGGDRDRGSLSSFVRDDARYDDAIRYWYETEGIIQDRGCMSTKGDTDSRMEQTSDTGTDSVGDVDRLGLGHVSLRERGGFPGSFLGQPRMPKQARQRVRHRLHLPSG